LALLRRAAPAASKSGIECEQPGCRQVLPSLHVVDAADHQIFGRAIDVEQRRFRGDFAQAAKAIAVDRVDRRLGQAQLERGAHLAVWERLAGEARLATPQPVAADRAMTAAAGRRRSQPARGLARGWVVFDHWEFLT
jgi:hypothetical protein